MTSRERVMRIMDHREADRIPVDFDCSQADKVEGILAFCGLKTKEDLLRRFDVDTRFCLCNEAICGVNRFDSRGTYIDIWGVERGIMGYPKNHPLADIETIKDIEDYDNWPRIEDIDYTAYTEQMKAYGDYAVFGGVFSSYMQVCEALLGTEKFMVMMLTEPEVLEYLLDRILAFFLEANRRLFDACGDLMQIFACGDDYGSQRDLLWSPEIWRRFVKPRQKKLYDLAHDRGYKVMQHSCGSIVKIIPEMVENGLDILQPIQVSAAAMDPAELKRRFGNQLTFMGAVDAQHVMPFGTTDDVRAEVKLRIEQLAANGGYIITTSQGIMPEVPNENIIAFYDAVKEFGWY